MNRHILLFPLLGLLLGNVNNLEGPYCLAFQNSRYSTSSVKVRPDAHAHSAGANVGDSGVQYHTRTRRRGLFYMFQNRRDSDTSRYMAATKNSDDEKDENDDDNEEKKEADMTQEEGWEFAMQLETKESFQPSPKSKSSKNGEDNDTTKDDPTLSKKKAAIAKLKSEVASKRAVKKAQAEAQRILEEANKIRAEQDDKLRQAEAEVARLKAEARAREEAEAAAKRKADTEAKAKAVKLKAEAEEKAKAAAEKEQKRLEAEAKAQKLKSQEEAKAKAAAAKEEKRLEDEKKAQEIATLLKAKEEAARVMAEIDAKLTAEVDKEEAERVTKLQADAMKTPALDDADDEILAKLMEEMEKVRIELDSRIKAEEEEQKREPSKAEAQNLTGAPSSELMERIKSGASYEKPKKVPSPSAAEEDQPVPTKKEELPLTSSTTGMPSKQPMPDLTPPGSKTTPVGKTTIEGSKKEKSKPKWMVDWKKDAKPSNAESEAKEVTTASKNTEVGSMEEKMEERADLDEKEEKTKDPRTTGKSSRENLFDVIGRTAGSTISMDELTKNKKKSTQQKQTPPSFEPEVVEESKKDGTRPMPDDLFNKKELKKRGPPSDFGSFAASASGKNPWSSQKSSKYEGPPPSFGASVAMASSGDVPQDLLSRGTASTDAGVSSPPPESSKKKKKDDSNIIDVVDAVYTKKDKPPKKKESTRKTKLPTPTPMNSAPPLEVEKTVPSIRKESKKNGDFSGTKKTNPSNSKSTPGPVNIGKAAVENASNFGAGDDRKESSKDKEPMGENVDTKIKDVQKEKSMEDRVAELLKEAFSLSKEDSRVADLLQGVVSITTGKDIEDNQVSAKNKSARRRKKTISEEDDDDDEERDEDMFLYNEMYEDDEDGEEDTAIMGRTRKRRNTEGANDFQRKDVMNDPNRRGPPNTRRIESTPVENEWGDDGFIETPMPSNDFNDYDGGGYFEDDDSEYFEYDENDTWRGRATRRPEAPQGGRYSVRPPPSGQGMDQSGFDSDEDYYFLKFGAPRPPRDPYDDRVDDMHYDDDGDYWDDEEISVQPGEPRPAYSAPDGVKKGPPSSFGNFVADASMAKTGYAPSSMKSDVDNNGSSGGTLGPDGDEWGDEMSSNTGSMLTPKGKKINGGSGGDIPSGGAPSKPLFVVSEDQGSSSGRGGKGPPSNFGKAVGAASEMQTGVNTSQRSIEEEIADGGMSTNTGMMATPRRKAAATPGNNSDAPSGSARQVKKPLFIVSEDDAATPDFGSSVAEASGARTGWAPKTPKRAAGGLDGGTTGGMRPKIKSPSNVSNPQNPSNGNDSQRPGFGSAVFDSCPTVPAGSSGSPNIQNPTPEGDRPVQKKESSDPDLMHKHQRNPAVKLVDGGASKSKPKQVLYSGSMMAPRVVRRNPSPLKNEDDKSEEDQGGGETC